MNHLKNIGLLFYANPEKCTCKYTIHECLVCKETFIPYSFIINNKKSKLIESYHNIYGGILFYYRSPTCFCPKINDFKTTYWYNCNACLKWFQKSTKTKTTQKRKKKKIHKRVEKIFKRKLPPDYFKRRLHLHR